MCNSQAEGGQRCYGHAKTALESAEAKYTTLLEQANDFTSAGLPVPAELRAQGMHAGFDREDALARYASTPQGEADLAARMDHLTVNGKAPSAYGPSGGSLAVLRAQAEYHDYAEAISAGQRLRDRAKEAHDGVRAGLLSGEQAAQLTQHPSETIVDFRRGKIASRRRGGRDGNNGSTPAPVVPPTLNQRRGSLLHATTASIASTQREVRAAVSFIAAIVHEKYPNAHRVELQGSDQGDWLHALSVDGDDTKLDNIDEDDLGWAASCIYTAHRGASPALHSADNQHIARTDNLYLDINEALAG